MSDEEPADRRTGYQMAVQLGLGSSTVVWNTFAAMAVVSTAIAAAAFNLTDSFSVAVGFSGALAFVLGISGVAQSIVWGLIEKRHLDHHNAFLASARELEKNMAGVNTLASNDKAPFRDTTPPVREMVYFVVGGMVLAHFLILVRVIVLLSQPLPDVLTRREPSPRSEAPQSATTVFRTHEQSAGCPPPTPCSPSETHAASCASCGCQTLCCSGASEPSD